jgi:hypothetical protein
MPLNVPLPRVESNRRPFGTYQLNNQPFRTQQKSTRDASTITDNEVRGLTNQKAPITNAPSTVPPPTLVAPRRGSPGRKLLAKVMGTPPNPFLSPAALPNILDFQGTNALGVSNQGENLRESPLVGVTRNELINSRRRLLRSDFSTPQPESPVSVLFVTPSPTVDRQTLGRNSSSGLASRLMSNDPLSSSGGAGARMSSDTTTDMSN